MPNGYLRLDWPSTWLRAGRVSIGTGQGNFLGQRDRSFFIVLGQRDNGTSSKSCHGTGRAGTVCQNPERPGTDEFVLGFLSYPCPGTKGQRDIPSQIVPTSRSLETLVKTSNQSVSWKNTTVLLLSNVCASSIFVWSDRQGCQHFVSSTMGWHSLNLEF